MHDGILIERVNPGELNVVARILAEAYSEDPIHLWSMPKTNTPLEDATIFFTLFLRWMRKYSWDVLATADRSAVLVSWLVRQGKNGYPDGVRYMPKLVRTKSHVNEYFQWIETFRPKIDHRYPEFMGCLKANRSKGIGSFLLSSLVNEAHKEGLPVWAWCSNPDLLPFYRRLGFEIGSELRQDDDTPPVYTIWHPVKPKEIS